MAVAKELARRATVEDTESVDKYFSTDCDSNKKPRPMQPKAQHGLLHDQLDRRVAAESTGTAGFELEAAALSWAPPLRAERVRSERDNEYKANDASVEISTEGIEWDSVVFQPLTDISDDYMDPSMEGLGW